MAAPIIAAITAIAALAQAGGEAMSAMSGAEEMRKKRRQEGAWHEDDLQQRAFENKLADRRFALDAETASQQKPMNTLSFINGLEDLKTKRQKSGSYLETIRGLAGR